MAQKTSLVCVLDTGRNLSENNKLNIAKALISSFAIQKVLSSKTFELGICCYGSNITKNHLNEQDAEQYIGVNEKHPLETISVDLLNNLREIQTTDLEGDIVDGVAVGYSILKQIGKKKCNRLMLIITDGESRIEGVEDLEAMVNEMILDVEEIKYTNNDEERIKNCVVLVAFIGNSKASDATSHAKENAKLLAEIANVTGGIFVEGTRYEDLLNVFECRGMGTRPMQTKTQLELSPSVKIPCIQWTKVSKVNFPSLKKESESYEPGNPDTGVVKRDTSYFIPSQDDQETLFEDRVKGFRYGSSFVPVASTDDMFEVQGTMGIKLIGFLSSTRIKRHHLMDTPIVLQGSPLNIPAQSALIALSRSLRSTMNAALARYVKKDNADVALVALLPSNHDDGTLLMFRLPCIEDMRDVSFPPLSNKPISKEQRTVVSNLVDALTLPSTDLPVCANTALLNFYFEVEKRATHSDSPLYHCDNMPSQGDLPRNSVVVNSVKQAFPLSTVEVKQGKPKKYWSDIALVGAAAEEVNISGTAALTTEEEAPSVAKFNAGTVTPVEDFSEIVAQYGSKDALLYNAAILEETVNNLIVQGSTGAHYRKAIGCLKVYRSTSVDAGEYAHFNTFMHAVKGRFSHGEHDKVWSEVTKAQLALISSKEVAGCPVSPTDSRDFLERELTVAMSVDTTSSREPVVEDDIFAEME